MAEQSPQRCVALYRVSTARQVHKDEADESLPLQRNAVRKFVASHPRWALTQEYTEEGVSAFKRSMMDRDVLQVIVKAAQARAFTVLVVFKADRLSRRSVEYPFILATLKKAGVQVFSAVDGKELTVDGQYEQLLTYIEGWQAETESVNTSLRVAESMRQLARQGRWSGGRPPFGYAHVPGRTPVSLVVAEEEARWLRLAFQWYLDDGIGTPTVTARLNEAGARQRNGHLWSDSMLRRIMQNPILKGQLAYGRTSQGRQGAFRKGAHDFEGVILSAPYPDLAIVPAERWDLAMDQMAHYNARRSRHLPRHSRADSGPLLFTGMARCARCDGPLVSIKVYTTKVLKTGPVKYWHPAYLCQNRATRGRGACDGQRTYSARRVETAILAALRETLHGLDAEEIVSAARRAAEQRFWATGTRYDLLTRQLAEAERGLKAWLTRLNQHLTHPDSSLYSEAVLAGQVREHEQRVTTLREEVATLSADRTAVGLQRTHLESFLRHAPDWWQLFLGAPRPQQKTLLKQLVERVTVGPDGFSIDYRVSQEALASPVALRWRATHRWQSTG